MIRNTLLVAFAVAMAGCTNATNETAPNNRTLLDYMNNLHADYVPLSANEMIADSDVIVRGYVTAVRDGRVVDNVSGPSMPMAMAVIEATVTDTIKGRAGERVYFEYIRGGHTPEQMAESLPADEFLLFLTPPRWDTKTHRFDYPERGLPPGEPLYVLRTQQAMLMQGGGVVTQPLEPGPPGSYGQLFDSTSLDEVESRIRNVMAGTTDAGQER